MNRKSIAQKIQTGTFRADRDNVSTPEFPKVEKLPPPNEMFGKRAKQIYQTTGKLLIEAGALTRVSFHLFELYCFEVEKYLLSHEAAASEPLINNRLNPHFRIMDTAFKNAVRLGGAFGLTPKIIIAPPEATDPKEEKFFGKL